MATGSTALPLILPNNFAWDQERNVCTKMEDQKREYLKTFPGALEMLRKIKGPVCVVAIAGPCRRGKSYILSKVFDQKEVFPLGKYMDPETSGIWIWVVAGKFINKIGQEFTVILMDSEGTDFANARKTDDHKIFTLSVLLASVLIYNSVGVPTRHDLDELEYIAMLSKRIKLHADHATERRDDSHFYRAFPHFIWLLRDVLLQLPPGFKDVKEYFLKKIFKHNESPDQAQEVAESILKFFSRFEAFALPSPSDKPDVVANLNNEYYKDQINPAFLEGVENFKQILKPTLAPKTSFNKGEFVTGEALAALVELYVKALNTPGEVPNVQTAWETFVETKCTEVKQVALRIYEQAMTSWIQGTLPCDTDLIRGAHLQAVELALQKFRKETYDISAASVEKHLKHLRELADVILTKWIENNKKKTTDFCRALLTKLKKKYMDPVLDRLTGPEGAKLEFAEIVNAMTTIEKEYNKNAKGAKDACASVFVEFHPELQQELEKNMQFLERLKDFDEKITKERAAIAAEKKRRIQMEERNAALHKEMEMKEKERALLEEKQKEDKRRFEENLKNLRTDHEEQMENIIQANFDELRIEREAQKEAFEQMLADRAEMLEKKNNDVLRLQEQIDDLTIKKNKERDMEIKEMQVRMDKMIALAEGMLESKNEDIERLRQEMEELRRKRDRERDEELRALREKLDATIKEMNKPWYKKLFGL